MKLLNIGQEDIVSVAPYRDQNGRRLITLKVANWKPSKVPIIDLLRGTLILFEMGSLEPQSQILGGIGIFDLEGLSLSHVLNVNPTVAQQLIALLVVCALFLYKINLILKKM